MAQLSYQQTERCVRFAHEPTDPVLCGSLLRLADEYAASAGEAENASAKASGNDDTTAWKAGSDDKDAD
jgi:hypothetical protein